MEALFQLFAGGVDATKGHDSDACSDCSASRMVQCKRVVAAVDAEVAEIMAKPAGGCASFVNFYQDIPADDRACILEVYSDIIRGMQRAEIKRLYHYNDAADRSLCRWKVGQQVPQYFANLNTGLSIWRRKMLSVAGLANLVIYGPEIFDELRAKAFSGCPADYGGEARGCETRTSIGMHKMKYYTGNSVDLDTVVLRCTDRTTLQAVNAQNMHQGLPLHASTDAFGASSQAREIAISAAGPLIDSFCADFGLQDVARSRRRLVFDAANLQQQVPLARTNKDRGMWPVWQYTNDGVNSFHVNVPSMPDVYGALIRAPWQLAKAWCTIHSEFEPGQEREKWVAEFFEDAVADSCFNGKWKAIEEFNARLSKLGSISDRLQKLQQRHQVDFAAIYRERGLDDAERDRREAALIYSICCQECPTGRDWNGQERAITAEDCKAFVADPGTPL